MHPALPGSVRKSVDELLEFRHVHGVQDRVGKMLEQIGVELVPKVVEEPGLVSPRRQCLGQRGGGGEEFLAKSGRSDRKKMRSIDPK